MKSLTDEELIVKYRSGSEEAFNELYLRYKNLVGYFCRKFYLLGVEEGDLIQEGMLGLIKAVNNFDFSFGVTFSTYAVPMVIGEIKRHLRDGNSMRVSRSIRDTAYLALKARGELEKNGQEATMENIATEMNVAVSEVVFALDAISDTLSLYEPVYNKSGDTLLLMDQLCDEKNTDEIWTEHVALSEAIGKLGERERKILYLRYYQGKTQTEISEEVGISQAQVSRLEKNALQAIKKNIS